MESNSYVLEHLKPLLWRKMILMMSTAFCVHHWVYVCACAYLCLYACVFGCWLLLLRPLSTIWHHLWQDKSTHTSTQFNLTTQDRMSLPFSFCLSEEDSSSGVTSHAVSPSVSPPHVSFPLTHRKLRACHVAKEHGSFLSEILFLLSFPLILCGLSLYFQHLWTNSKIQLDTISQSHFKVIQWADRICSSCCFFFFLFWW